MMQNSYLWIVQRHCFVNSIRTWPYDFMQQEGHCIDYTKATALELRAMKEWMKPYTDQLPEYQYILEDILPKKS